MHKIIGSQKIEKSVAIFLTICIFLYPFITSFFGVDLGDTGIHLFNYENIFTHPELVGFTAYFTNVTGWLWLRFFGNLGIWGLNLFEVIIEMIMAFIVYKTFNKYLGKIQTLIGILIAVMATDTYLNVFNYHQYNVLFLIIILSLEFKAIIEEKKVFTFFAGVFLTIVTFSRMGSITALSTCFLYVFYYFFNNEKIQYLLRHLGVFFLGVLSAGVVLSGGLLFTGQMEYFVNNIFRLSGLASASDGGYSINNLWSTFLFGNLDAIASGFLFFSAGMVLLLGINLVLDCKGKRPKTIVLNILIFLIIGGISIYQLIYAYDVNTAPDWPQMTSGPSFMIGLLYVVTFFYMFFNIYGNKGRKELVIVGICAIILPLLTIVGSNTGTKHVILGFWIIAPYVVSALSKLLFSKDILNVINAGTQKIGIKIKHMSVILVVFILGLFAGLKFLHMIYYTMNFDSVDRSSLQYSVESDKLKYMKTTKREADAVNGVLESIDSIQSKDGDNDRPLMVFGGSILMYSLTDMDSFVQPWVTNSNYTDEQFVDDIETSKENYEELPVVIFGRTNNYYGFEEYNYDVLISSELSNEYAGKKGSFMQFLQDNDYKLEYMNDYYLVLAPDTVTNSEDADFYGYISVQE